jgi:hypoxanthine phosphoribosyltransferase
MGKVYVSYDQVHSDTRTLFEQLKNVSPQGVILIAVARGGWITTRILAASYEEDGIENHSYSIDATYQNHGSPDEYAVLTQGLDEKAVEIIDNLLSRELPIVVVDSVCQTGRELVAVRDYLSSIFPNAKIVVAIMNWVKYKNVPQAPWRTAALAPDFYGSLIEMDQMPYVEYPWEYSSVKNFTKLRRQK